MNHRLLSRCFEKPLVRRPIKCHASVENKSWKTARAARPARAAKYRCPIVKGSPNRNPIYALRSVLASEWTHETSKRRRFHCAGGAASSPPSVPPYLSRRTEAKRNYSKTPPICLMSLFVVHSDAGGGIAPSLTYPPAHVDGGRSKRRHHSYPWNNARRAEKKNQPLILRNMQ
ncbi:hypothetical protein EVAR_20852_1 [Eumeta japonica]|uniref:Uncharacterized protein n=1 Tax=Eumeta variegata TaxID=151549 RepID=A0A4C1UDS5_EUMVA|nr:hypothetical protein EVAR_20852_1 [Eumeta japonica]